MQELKFRNFIPSLFALIAAITISTASNYINISPFSLPVPLLIIGIFAGFLVLNFISYPKATTIQILQLSITGVFINALVLVTAIYGIKYFNLASITLDSDFILSVNPLTPSLSFIFSYLTLISVVRFEDKIVVPKKFKDKENKQAEQQTEDIEPEVIPFETKKAEKPVKISEKTDESTPEKPKSLYEELYPQAKTEPESVKEPEEKEFLLDFSQEESQKAISKDEKPTESKEEFIELDSLPSLNLEEKPQENKTQPAPPAEDNSEEYFDFIPTDIRLVEAPVSKDNDSKGKIAAIGKLLVNNRDIENVIESSVAIAESGIEGKTNVLSSVSGEQIYEKFNRLKQEFEHIREIALVDKGGFILASDYEDKININITGALIAGSYHTLQNYLSQIPFIQPERIFFETENSNNFIIRTNDEFLFSVWNKDFAHIDYSALQSFIDNETISDADMTPLVELGQITNFAASNGSGELINSLDDSNESKKIAAVSSALFENFKVFLMNIKLMKLKRITIFNPEEVITINKFDDGIASFITPIDGLVKISDEFQKIEGIY